MRYLKLFESFNLNSIESIKGLFVDLEDQNFTIDVIEDKCSDFMEKRKEFNTYGTLFHKMTKNGESELEDMLIVTISKMVPNNKRFIQTRFLNSERVPEDFNRDEILETLLFAESYSAGEMSLGIKWIFNGKKYYKFAKDIPNEKIDELIIGFGKN